MTRVQSICGGTNVTTTRGSAHTVADGTGTRAYVSRNWRGKITCRGPLVMYRERGWLDHLRNWIRDFRQNA